jgi:hypothetical protein
MFDENTNTDGWIPQVNVGNANDQPISGENFYTKIYNVGNIIITLLLNIEIIWP